MGISRSTYYHKSIREKEQMDRDLELKQEIEKIHLQFPGYGYRRIHEHLLRKGLSVNGKRIRRVMKMYSLFSSRTKLMRPRGLAIGRQLVHPNLIAGLRLKEP